MDSFNWLNFTITVLSSSLLTTVIIIISPVLKKVISGYIDNKFEEKIIKYKHELNLLTENARLDIQRKIYDFSLYSSRKHDIYVELYKKILVSHGQVIGLMGIRDSVDLNKLDKSHIIELMKNNNFNEQHIIRIAKDWDSDQKAQIDKISEYLRNKEFNQAETSLIITNNYYLESLLYLSIKTEKLANTIIKELRKLFHIYNMSHYYKYYPDKSEYDEQKIKNYIEENMTQFRDSLKDELSRGNYIN